jgi:hypothetical protein
VILVNKTKAKTKEELVKEVVQAAVKEVVNAVVASCRVEVASNIGILIPEIIDWTKKNPDKGPADFSLPSYVGSNSVNITPPAPAHAIAHAPTPGPAPIYSSPSFVSGMLGGASSLAELDALTVITRHTLFTTISIVFCFSFLSDV